MSRDFPTFGALLIAVTLIATLVMAFVGEPPAGPRASVIRGGDLIPFWAGGAILAGDDGATQLYDRPRYLREMREQFPVNPPRYRLAYPPPIYQVCSWFQGLPYPTFAAAFLLAMTALYALAAWLLVRGVPALRSAGWVAWAFAFGCPASLMMVLTGQFSGVWVLLLAGAAVLWRAGRPLPAGMLLGLLCAKPPLAVPVLLGLLLAGQGRALLGFVLGGAALLGGSIALDGVQPWLGYREMLRGTPDLAHRMWIMPERQMTARGMVGWLLQPNAGGGIAGWLGLAAAGGLAAWVAREAWGARPQREGGLLALGAALSAALLAAPHLFDYDLGMHGIGMVASAAWLLRPERVARPRAGVAVCIAAYLAVLAYPASRWLHCNLGVAALLVWVVWMTLELRSLRLGQREQA
jgi:Glycosyltransferase family 87